MIMFVHGYESAVKRKKGHNILYLGNDLSFLHELVIFSVGVDRLSVLDDYLGRYSALCDYRYLWFSVRVQIK